MTSRSIMMALAVSAIDRATAPPTTSARHPTVDPVLLQPLTPADIQASHIYGVGCSWSQGRDPQTRLIMADDHALAKIDGTVTILMPATSAKELFPFTFDRWQGGESVIQVRQRGPSRRDGSEALVTKADLLIRRGPNTNAIHGIITCGS